MRFNVLLILHLIALHTSIAAMEVFSWIIFLVAIALEIKERRGRLSVGCDWWLIGFAVITLIGILLSGMSQKEAIFEMGFMRWILLLYSFAFAWRRSGLIENHDRLIWIWAGVAGLAGVYAFFQYFAGIDFFRPHHPIPPAGIHGYRARGFFSQSLTLAYVLGISAAFLLPQLRRVANPRLLMLALFLIMLGLFASLSRGSWIAILIVMFVFAFQEWGRKAIWGLVPAALIFAGLFTFEPEFQRRILDLFNFDASSSSGERLDLWRGYWRVFLDHPVFGAGLFYGDEYLPEVFRRLGIEQAFVSHAHNNYLQALAGTGVLGFVCFVAFNFYFLRLAYRAQRRLGGMPAGRLAQGVFLAQIFWQLGGLTECNFFDGEVNHMIVFTWALLVAVTTNSSHQRRT